MKAIVLAAGEGQRCRPLTATRSKVMLPVVNRPILEYVIEALVKNDIKDIILIVGYEKERIMDYFEDGVDFGASIKYIEQEVQLGTSHAIEQARPYIEKGMNFLVLNGDNIIESSTIKDLLNSFKGEATILTSQRDDISEYGVVLTKGSKVTKIIEKPKSLVSHLVNTGMYVFNENIFPEIEKTTISQRGEYEITDALQNMIEKGEDVHTVTTKHLWMDSRYPWDLLKSNSSMLNRKEEPVNHGKVEEGATIVGEVSVGENTIIRAGSYIVGPVALGRNCDIGPNAVVLPSTSIGKNVSIEPFTTIKNSIIMDNVRIGPHSHISHSVIANNTSLGPYFATEAKDNTGIKLGNELVDAGKIGAIVGEDCEAGLRVLTKAGAIISKGCSIGSDTTIRELLPENSVVL
ncbi:glucose-1-phosphate thymidylyltransferase [Methanohalophilus levihalophilus]|uniref:bifunctional sugar-1-phosphate nucleotidylyltransferase/acetyltransferase n=1 Tax=Methanohalophilus levihalophilus TaxID=1431282 RepID=UPI001AEAB9B9|nr:bifunctional sugar-1-phosphate nucleotidylyltransferase/acetyltransferase [Methanohalophilus levihalophilus]MBP2031080.1 glucose-1-phosphate thymidylyltransferase [Methanohalophilus levihalophilus]